MRRDEAPVTTIVLLTANRWYGCHPVSRFGSDRARPHVGNVGGGIPDRLSGSSTSANAVSRRFVKKHKVPGSGRAGSLDSTTPCARNMITACCADSKL